MMTRLEALELSEPLEKVYADATDQCLVNIARHFNTGKNLPSLEWQMRKLAELGQVTRENIRIIARATGQNEELVMAALQSSFADALKEVDPKLREAAMRGFTEAQPSETVLAYGAANALQQYQSQATEDLNLVNTVMLNSSLEQYRRVISNTVQYEAQLNKAQEILNETTGEAILGVATRQQAIRKALKQMSDEGLTGFVDKGGHHWSPEAYVAMDVRTTITNTAHAAVDQRMEDYGLDLIEVTAHAGARPLCYPFQGKLFSMSNRSGVTTDLNGEEIPYAPFNTTSYGEPAGLFGINCGHFKYPFIPGFSRQRDWPVQDQEENDRVYAESQQQRALERNIRYAKREAEIMNAAGDTEGAIAANKNVKAAQANMREFINETGRTRRYDREQIGTASGRSQGGTPTPTQTQNRTLKPKTSTKKKNITAINELQQYSVNGASYIVDGKNVVQDHTEEEKETALVLAAHLGETVSLVPKINKPENLRVPDYVTESGEAFERKGLHGESVDGVYNAIHKNAEQSSNFIVDITDSKAQDREALINNASNVFKRRGTKFVDRLILVENGTVIEDWQKEK